MKRELITPSFKLNPMAKKLEVVESSVRGFLGYKTNIPVGSGILNQIGNHSVYVKLTKKQIIKLTKVVKSLV
jgi:hypothetical protein